jgi:hypothetical protein
VRFLLILLLRRLLRRCLLTPCHSKRQILQSNSW